ncbi:MAG: translocation/assembly module TamB, partial [Proteobacteria bacterium]|nr:translocation/assembly module TamB [Pseudomonadota bacterium]
KIHSHLHSSDEISTLLSLEQLFFKDLDVDLEFSGPLNRPLITLQGTISEIGRTDAPFPLTGAFDLGYSDKGIIINKMSWWVQDNQRINLTGTVPYDPLAENKFLPGNLSLQGHMEVADLSILGFVPFLHDIRGGLSGSVKLAGTWDNPLGSLQIKTQQFSVPSLYAYMPEKTINLEIEATLADQTLSVTRLLAESPSLFITGSGKWSEFPALPQVVKGDPQLVTGNLKGQGKLKVSNMSWLGQKITGIRRLGGLLEIDGFVEGPVSDPSISGALTITNGEIRPDYAVPSIRNFTLRADISKKFLTIKECHGEVGGAPFIVSGQIDSPWGENAVAGLELQGDNLLFFRNDGIKLRGDTEIKVSGPIDQLQITGILKITDGKFTRNFDFLGILKEPGKSEGNGRIFDFSFLDPPLNKAYFNLDIQSKKPFLIKNNLAKGSLRPEMKIVGYGDLLTLRGYLYLDLIKIKLPAGNFFIKSGIVHFPDNDPDRPTLKINGSSQLLGYDISVAIQGYYDEPEITLSSSPPLPNDELLLLLLAGKTPKSESMAGGITQSGMNVAVYLGRDLLEKWFSDQSTENDESLLDRFEIEIGKRVTRSGDETINSQFLITDNFIKKGNALYLSTERDVFDDFNAGLKLMFKFK